MTRLVLAGTYPRREEHVKATWNFDKGLLDAKDLDAERLAQAKELVALQEELGFEAATDGNLTWQDTFRGVVDGAGGWTVGGVTRLFETNKFYRQPHLVGEPKPEPKALEKHFLLEKVRTKLPKKAILPSPYWLVKALANETSWSDAQVGQKVATYLNRVATWLVGKGYAHIQFQEPLLFYEKKPETKRAFSLLETALEGLKAHTVVNFPNGDAGPHIAWLAKVPCSQVGIDFVETHADAIKAPRSFPGVLAHVVDSQESLLEDPAQLRALAHTIQARLRPPSLTLTHTWDLEFLSAPIARKKVEILAAAVTKEVVA